MNMSTDQILLTNEESDTIGEVLNISMGAAATAIAVMLNRQVNITTPAVKVIRNEDFNYSDLEPALGVEINYIDGLHGSNLLIMSVSDIKKIVSSLLGEGIEENDELNEIHISALGEVMNQMMGSASTALATFFDKSVNISPPNVVNPNEFYKNFFEQQVDDAVVTVTFKFVVDDLIDSEFITVFPIEFAKEIVRNAMNFDQSGPSEVESVFEDNSSNNSNSNVTGHTQIHNPVFAEEKRAPAPERPRQQPPQKIQRVESAPLPKPSQNISVQNIQFQSFDDNEYENDTLVQTNLDLVMGVEVAVTVEIGRTKRQVRDVLNIAKGSIIELDKRAGDSVDVIVNGQLIAMGDVVVIDDNFGVRITKVLNGKD